MSPKSKAIKGKKVSSSSDLGSGVVPTPLQEECPKATPLGRLLEQEKMGLEKANFGQESRISSEPPWGSPGVYEPSRGVAFLGPGGDLQAGKRSCTPGVPAGLGNRCER